MAKNQITRRQIVVSLATVAGCSLQPAAMAQEPVDFPLPQENEVLNAYRVEQIDGYTKIIMDHVREGVEGSGTLDVKAIRTSLNQEARQNGTPVPIIITDYGYHGPTNLYPRTHKNNADHENFFDVALPHLASISRRPVVFLDVAVFGANPANELESLHLPALNAELENNRLGHGGSHATIPEDELIVPYMATHIDGRKVQDASFAVYGDDVITNDINIHVSSELINIVNNQNQILTPSLD